MRNKYHEELERQNREARPRSEMAVLAMAGKEIVYGEAGQYGLIRVKRIRVDDWGFEADAELLTRFPPRFDYEHFQLPPSWTFSASWSVLTCFIDGSFSGFQGGWRLFMSARAMERTRLLLNQSSVSREEVQNLIDALNDYPAMMTDEELLIAVRTRREEAARS